MKPPFEISCRPPILLASFDTPQTMLSWSVTKPGFQISRRVAWLEVRNADLRPCEDPVDSIRRMTDAAGLGDAIVLVTSRDITRHHLADAAVEGTIATCLATAGLSNGERVGQRLNEPDWLPGTINILLHVSCPLSQAALIEAVSIVTEARTAAILDAGVRRAGIAVTGTGTDCIVVAAPQGSEGARFAGLHTAVGEAVGAAVYRSVREGVDVWQRDFTEDIARKSAAAE